MRAALGPRLKTSTATDHPRNVAEPVLREAAPRRSSLRRSRASVFRIPPCRRDFDRPRHIVEYDAVDVEFIPGVVDIDPDNPASL